MDACTCCGKTLESFFEYPLIRIADVRVVEHVPENIPDYTKHENLRESKNEHGKEAVVPEAVLKRYVENPEKVATYWHEGFKYYVLENQDVLFVRQLHPVLYFFEKLSRFFDERKPRDWWRFPSQSEDISRLLSQNSDLESFLSGLKQTAEHYEDFPPGQLLPVWRLSVNNNAYRIPGADKNYWIAFNNVGRQECRGIDVNLFLVCSEAPKCEPQSKLLTLAEIDYVGKLKP